MAVRLCVPLLSVEVVNDALPPDRGTVTMVAAPSLKVTCPVGTPAVRDFTVAVMVTVCPNSDGFLDDVRVEDVGANLTVCFSTAEVLPNWSVLPLKTAVIEWLPTARVETASVAVPPARGLTPSVVAPFLKVTVPLGVTVDVTLAVNVTT